MVFLNRKVNARGSVHILGFNIATAELSLSFVTVQAFLNPLLSFQIFQHLSYSELIACIFIHETLYYTLCL